MKKINTENLPKWESGRYKGKINWKNSIGHKIYFIYNDISGNFVIKDFEPKGQRLIISYCNNDYETSVCNLYNFRFGKILGIITIDFKIKIGTTFKDESRNITITDRFYKKNKNKTKKYYKYKCNVCGAYDIEVDEYKILKGNGCSCCAGRTVVEGINDIPTTAPWMVKYFQGGYDEAKKYTKSSNKTIYPICSDCGKVKNKPMQINHIHKKQSIGCTCSDGISYPEKFMISFLSQLNIDYIYQLTKTTCKWCDSYMYDFYIEEKSCIIEVHGSSHYNINGFASLGGRTLKEEIENDKTKEELAKRNGVDNYIIINAKKSEIDWIKNSIINSNLFDILNFNMDDIDWIKCEEEALSNKVKEACDLWNKGIKTPKIIGALLKLNRNTVTRYLKRGKDIGWCDYNKDKVVFNNKTSSKKVAVYKNKCYLNSFKSITYLSEKSVELFGVKLFISEISNCCNGKSKQYKGYEFKFIESES